jgi:hypothetical protein
MPDGRHVEAPERADRLSLHELVVACCNKRNVCADRVWDMSVADICLSVREPAGGREEATDKLAQAAMCREVDRRREASAGLSTARRVELARLVAELT